MTVEKKRMASMEVDPQSGALGRLKSAVGRPFFRCNCYNQLRWWE